MFLYVIGKSNYHLYGKQLLSESSKKIKYKL